MPIVFAAITPHPPVAIPNIGKKNIKEVKKTVFALGRLEQDLYASKPDTLLIISPHGKIIQDAININLYPKYEANFDEFGDFSTKLSFKSDPLTIQEIRSDYEMRNKINFILTSDSAVDYGTSVPLFYLLQHLKDLPVIPATTSGQDLKTHFEFGLALKKILSRLDKRIAIISSGELSHKLTKSSPGGYSNNAEIFDKNLIQILKNKKTKDIFEIRPDLIQDVSECCLKSLSILFGIVDDLPYDLEILSYEYPFGTGYLVGELMIK